MLLAVVAIGTTGAALGGCGTGKPSNVVAEVGHTAITKSALGHWLHIAAVRDYELHAQSAVPAGVVPDPPRYTRCTGRLEMLASQPSTADLVQTTTPFKQQCEERYRTLREQALGSLISGYWLIEEGKARGLVATEQAVQAHLEMTWKGLYSTKREYERSLINSGETIADQLLRARIEVFSTEIEKQYGISAASKNDNSSAFAQLNTQLPRKWAARTSCRPGYVVPNCKQYKGQLAPEIQLL